MTRTNSWLLFLEGMSTSLSWGMSTSIYLGMSTSFLFGMPTSLLFVKTWYFTISLLKDWLDALLGGTLTRTNGWLLYLEYMSTSLSWGMSTSIYLGMSTSFLFGMPISLIFFILYFTVLLLKDWLDTLWEGTLKGTNIWLLFLENISTYLFWGMSTSIYLGIPTSFLFGIPTSLLFV